jgi:SprT protein
LREAAGHLIDPVLLCYIVYRERGMTVEPITLLQQDQVVSATRQCILRGEKRLGQEFELPPVTFDLQGRAAGMYRVRSTRRQIRYNPYIFGKYFTDNLVNTVPHEVAHYLTDMLFGLRNVRPHGREWQAVMRVLGAEPTVTCHYDLTGVPLRRQRRFSYRCGCSSHAVSAVRHNRVQRGLGKYVCRHCRTPLVFAG